MVPVVRKEGMVMGVRRGGGEVWGHMFLEMVFGLLFLFFEKGKAKEKGGIERMRTWDRK